MKLFAIAVAAIGAILGLTLPVQAQVVQPEPGPQPSPILAPYYPPVMTFYPQPPAVLRPTAYSFNGPTAAPTLQGVSTTTFYQPAPGSNLLMSTTLYTPIYGYTPGYYRDYYTPLFFRP